MIDFDGVRDSPGKYARGSRFVLQGEHVNRPANPKAITRGVQRLLPRFLAHEIESFTAHDLRRTGRTTLGRPGVTPFVAERVINHSKGVLEETYDLWNYCHEKRDACIVTLASEGINTS